MLGNFFNKAAVLAVVLMLTALFSVSAMAVEENTVMTVYAKNHDEEIYKEFDNFEDGWVYALQQSLEAPTTVTLEKDWVAPEGGFRCLDENGDEYGTTDGCLYIDDNHVITIDLNGHKIDRSLSAPTENGMVFLLNDLDASLTVKDSAGGGKITGANNDGDGGAFYAYDGSLYIESGEITGNYADNGAGIYWYSDNELCITGGKITGNTAREVGGGIYHNGGGSFGGNADNVYFGGTLQIYGNLGNSGESNVYIKSSRAINRTAGQFDKIPDVPFTDGASIGISMYPTEGTVIICGPDSRFDSNNFGYFFGDNSNYFVRAVFDESGANNTHKLFYNKWGYKDAVFPKIKSVAPRKNNGLVSEASIDLDKQIITLKAISPDRRPFKSVVVESLVYFVTSNNEDVYWRFCDVAYDLTKPVEYKVVSKSTGTYVHCRVIVEFPECTHSDADKNYICDNCEESIIIYGDINRDAEVTVSDVIFMLQTIASDSALTDEQRTAGDVNGDDAVDVSDVIRILQYLASPDLPLVPQK